MPAVKIALDIDTRKLVNLLTGATLQTFSAKNGNIIDFELSITHLDVPISLPVNSSVTFAVKKPTDQAGTYIISDDAVRSGWGTGSRWFFRADLSTVPIDQVGKNLEAEILLETPNDGQRISSLTFVFIVLKNVIP
jgi:hypothetical protein